MSLLKSKVKKADTNTVLHHATLTAAVREIKPPASFLFDLLFSARQAVSTEQIEIGVWHGERQMAPFVRKNGEALLVGGPDQKIHVVEPTNIRIKRPLVPSKIVFDRKPGSAIFGEDAQASSIAQTIAEEQRALVDQVTNREEWLAAQALRMQVTYSVSDQENFQITFPRAAGHTTTATRDWDDGDPSLPNIEQDFENAMKLVSEETGVGVTHCVLGAQAATWFKHVLKNQKLLDMLHVNAGMLDLARPWLAQGARYLGDFCGVQVWTYPRRLDGKNLIREKYAEFVSVTPAAQNVCYYGAVADDDGSGAMLHVGARFSKSWVEQDPSQRVLLLASRPLCVPRRPNSTVSMKVVSGSNPAAD